LFIAVFDLVRTDVLHVPYDEFRWAFNVKTFIGNVLMLQDYPLLFTASTATGKAFLHITSFGTGRPLWTLAVEWWLYLFFGWIVLNYKSFNQGHSVRYVLILMVFSVVPLWNTIGGRSGGGFTYFWFIGVLMMWLFSVIRVNNIPRRITCLAVAALFSFLAILRYCSSVNAYDAWAGITLACGIFFLCLAFRTTNLIGPKAQTAIRFVAGYSFTLYLIHYTICDCVSYLLPKVPGTVLLPVSLVLCNVVALSLASVTEMRHRQLNRAIKKWLGMLKPAEAASRSFFSVDETRRTGTELD
jgi:peptidoglycan/LPS O-acetylase OafA/YrhL